jgi:hypothetical protein
LSALLEVLDTLKAPGISERHIQALLSTPAIEWKPEINRNQSANIDPTTANDRVKYNQLEVLYYEYAPNCNTDIFDKMMELSVELNEMTGVLYRHDPYQATIASIVAAINKQFTLLTLPTGCGKTFIIGLLYNYWKKVKGKSVIAVVPSD